MAEEQVGLQASEQELPNIRRNLMKILLLSLILISF
jgi:hypothetical protein